ncbi:hypothetical protein BDR26DRAFT_899760 [Obelidium mucronatum]|nr:hypothetical protein BDR26DRAFT_899760 [Obelidium mucronatum]
MDTYYNAITSSKYWSILSQYNIGDGALANSVRYPTGLDADNLKGLFTELISKGLIKPDANTYYPIHYGPSKNPIGGCDVFCGLHDSLDVSGTAIYYGQLPYHGNSGCQTGCGGSDIIHDTLTGTQISASHELAEAVTEPVLKTGWYDKESTAQFHTVVELADPGACSLNVGRTVGRDGVTYPIQPLFSIKDNGCVDYVGGPVYGMEVQPDGCFLWDAGNQYDLGTCVDYNGNMYRLLQTTIANKLWTPDVVASIYQLIGPIPLGSVGPSPTTTKAATTTTKAATTTTTTTTSTAFLTSSTTVVKTSSTGAATTKSTVVTSKSTTTTTTSKPATSTVSSGGAPSGPCTTFGATQCYNK